MNVTTKFEKVLVGRTESGTCSVCGKRTRRSRMFWHTVNPFNRREDGQPKTRAEVLEDVRAEAKAWEPDFRHVACKAEAEAHSESDQSTTTHEGEQ